MAEDEQSLDSARTDPNAGVVSLHTAVLGAQEARDEWQSVLGSLYAEVDIAWPDRQSRLDAEWGGRPLGDLHVSKIRCDQQTVIRSPAMIASDASEGYIVCLVTDGQVEVQQNGRTTRVGAGTFSLLDLGTPFIFHSPTVFEQVVLHVPNRALVGRLPEVFARRATARTLGADGGAAILSRLVADLASADLSPGTAAAFASSSVEMLSATLLDDLVGPEREDSYRAKDLARVRHAIEEHLHDSELTVADVAERCGMSLRNMQKLVRSVDTTPNAMLYQARIERAKYLLVSTESSVATISEQVGFRDVSHFSRVFRKHAGVSPGGYRNNQAHGGIIVPD
ncbi:AraC family transcriptional regulator [Gordonia rubripertincta]|uniref:helix-turn-helix transcriptional regulator n=1 Tax=Gordonia rubripertincta TaxID=36822 RepID=UPI00117D8346|nr:AraC family transcriptional regulator [Gordonia rubripertincta]TSD97448.1 AraC family transcriptional regulator [Gordonia rubripertincta]